MGAPKVPNSVIRVLVVDDDIVVGMLLAMQLEQVEVLEATRIAQGLAMARKQRPDAVIVDRKLSDGDGLDLVRTLRSTSGTEDVPILLITAGHDPADRPEVLGAGADEYLAKPFEPADLEKLLRDLLAVTPDTLRSRRHAAQRGRPLHAESDLADAAPTAAEEGPPARRRWRRS